MAYVIKDVNTERYMVASPFCWVDKIELASAYFKEESVRNLIEVTYKKRFAKDKVNAIAYRFDNDDKFVTAPCAPLLTEEIANKEFQKISSALYALRHINTLYDYWIEKEAKYERMTQDILHKIELDDVSNCIDAFKIMQLLKEVRIKRREAKEKVAILMALKDDGINMERIVEASTYYDKTRGDRTYTPRELPELFENNNKKEG